MKTLQQYERENSRYRAALEELAELLMPCDCTPESVCPAHQIIFVALTVPRYD